MPTKSKRQKGLIGDSEALADTIRSYPWTTLASLEGDPHVLQRIEETEKLLQDPRRL